MTDERLNGLAVLFVHRHYARRRRYWWIWKIESLASFISRPRPIKWNTFGSGAS